MLTSLTCLRPCLSYWIPPSELIPVHLDHLPPPHQSSTCNNKIVHLHILHSPELYLSGPCLLITVTLNLPAQPFSVNSPLLHVTEFKLKLLISISHWLPSSHLHECFIVFMFHSSQFMVWLSVAFQSVNKALLSCSSVPLTVSAIESGFLVWLLGRDNLVHQCNHATLHYIFTPSYLFQWRL